MIEGKGQNIVVPGGPRRRSAQRQPPDEAGRPVRSAQSRRQRQRLPERRHRLVSQDVHAPGERGLPPRVPRVRGRLHELGGLAQRREDRQAPVRLLDVRDDLTPLLKYGGAPNVLAVRVYVPQPSSRWYSGAGIYRHVWLTVTNPVHVAQWGTVVTTPDITDARARCTCG